MKKLGVKLLAGGILLAMFSFTSCKSNGYGCDYGAVESQDVIEETQTLEVEDALEEKYTYTKFTKE